MSLGVGRTLVSLAYVDVIPLSENTPQLMLDLTFAHISEGHQAVITGFVFVYFTLRRNTIKNSHCRTLQKQVLSTRRGHNS